MFRAIVVLALTLAAAFAAPEPPRPEQVAVIFNRNLPESEALAETYAEARSIPASHLVGLDLPDEEQIDRETFDTRLRDPLIEVFDRREWWLRAPDAEGNMQLRQARIRVLCTVRGVPSRIRHPRPEPPAGEKRKGANKEELMGTMSAAVDSELALLGTEGLPLAQAVNNPYFKQDQSFAEAGLPMFLVGRLDAHSFAVCERMIRDAVEAEKTGLWGFAAIDIAKKSVNGPPMGDPWLETVAADLAAAGIPTLVDRFSETLPRNFPLRDTALYYGWYDWHVSGPFKNPDFRFRPGAVAAHIHSFSAQQLRNPARNWSAPLLAKGAAATLGNTFEPFLHLTHHLDIFNDRLLQGYSLAEASAMAMPALSWHAIALGDPLYRPFRRLDGSGRKRDDDAVFRALRIARLRWADDTATRDRNLREAAGRMEDGRLLEGLALDLAARNQPSAASQTLREAKLLYPDPDDRLRVQLLIAKHDREAGRKAAAIQVLRAALRDFPHLNGAESAKAWLETLDPPPDGKSTD